MSQPNGPYRIARDAYMPPAREPSERAAQQLGRNTVAQPDRALYAVPETPPERPPNVGFGDPRAEIAARRYEAAVSQRAPRVPWEVFMKFFNWEQGQHVAVIGPNGSGKTTLMISLLPLRRYVTVFATKPVDRTLDSMAESDDYDILESWMRIPAEKSPRRILWPDARDIDAEDSQAKIFDHAFKAIFREGGWTLVIDEGWYISDVLGQSRRMRTMWTQARSLGISFVVGTQRPAWVPIEMYSESTHLFIYKLTEKAAVDRVSYLGQADVELAKKLIRNLEPHQCLYVNTRTGEMMRTRAPAPKYHANDEAPEKGRR